jgi:hypothetical protein
MKKSKTILTVVAVALAVFAGSAQATIVGPYRLAFITSTDPGATLSTIEEYNALVQGLADAAGIGGDIEWFVIGSTDLVDARDNTGTNPAVDGVGVPIYLVDEITLVANNNADLWDHSIQHIINQTENGDTKSHWPFTGTYWDGTNATGKVGTNSNAGALGTSLPETTQGNGSSTTDWVWRQMTNDPSATALPLYAMSEIIPEPATICLLALGGLALLRKKR